MAMTTTTRQSEHTAGVSEASVLRKRDLQRIVVGVDDTPSASRVLEWAASRLEPGGRVIAVHSVSTVEELLMDSTPFREPRWRDTCAKGSPRTGAPTSVTGECPSMSTSSSGASPRLSCRWPARSRRTSSSAPVATLTGCYTIRLRWRPTSTTGPACPCCAYRPPGELPRDGGGQSAVWSEGRG